MQKCGQKIHKKKVVIFYFHKITLRLWNLLGLPEVFLLSLQLNHQICAFVVSFFLEFFFIDCQHPKIYCSRKLRTFSMSGVGAPGIRDKRTYYSDLTTPHGLSIYPNLFD